MQSELSNAQNTDNYSIVEKLLSEFPNKNWNFKWISSDNKVSYEFIIANPHLNWNKSRLLINPNIYEYEDRKNEIIKLFSIDESNKAKVDNDETYENIRDVEYDARNNLISNFIDNIIKQIKSENPDFVAPMNGFNLYDKITELFNQYPVICSRKLYEFYVDNVIDGHVQLKIYFHYISMISNIELFIHSFENHKYMIHPVEYYKYLSKISYNGVSLDTLRKHKDKPWHLKSLIRNVNCLDYFLEMGENCDMFLLSQNGGIKITHLEQYPQLKWDMFMLSITNNGITINDILNNPQYKWDYSVCMTHRICVMGRSFDLETLKKLIELYESFKSLKDLNISKIHSKVVYKSDNYDISNSDNDLYFKYSPIKYIADVCFSLDEKYPNLNKENGQIDGLCFLNLTGFLNMPNITLDCVNYILDNYKQYINPADVKFTSPDLTYELYKTYDFDARQLSGEFYCGM